MDAVLVCGDVYDRAVPSLDAVELCEDALVRLKASKYDAVIVDMRMPDLSGEQLFERLRSNDPGHAERVIFTTGDLVNDQMRRFLDGTGRPCVPKPFEFASFDQALPAARRRA